MVGSRRLIGLLSSRHQWARSGHWTNLPQSAQECSTPYPGLSTTDTRPAGDLVCPGQAHDTGRSSFARNTRYASVMEQDPTEPSRQDHDSGPDRPEPEPEPEPFVSEGTDQGPGRFVAHDAYT